MDQLRVGIVGCGKMGREHASAATSLGARVRWVSDIDASSATSLAEQHGGCEAIEGVGPIDPSVVDAVLVCTPPSSRGPVERAAIAAGLPFFVEKPVGLGAAHASAILDDLRARPVIHSVGYMHRYRRSVREARAWASGAELVGATFTWVGKPYDRPWWARREASGGPFNEQCTHFVDLARWLAGEIVEVSAIARPSSANGVEDTVACALRFASGAGGTLLYCCRGQEKQLGVDLLAAGGHLRLEGKGLTRRGERADEEDVVSAELEAFFVAVRARTMKSILSSFEDAMRTQLAVDAILCSMRRGGPQRVERLPAAL